MKDLNIHEILAVSGGHCLGMANGALGQIFTFFLVGTAAATIATAGIAYAAYSYYNHSE